MPTYSSNDYLYNDSVLRHYNSFKAGFPGLTVSDFVKYGAASWYKGNVIRSIKLHIANPTRIVNFRVLVQQEDWYTSLCNEVAKVLGKNNQLDLYYGERRLDQLHINTLRRLPRNAIVYKIDISKSIHAVKFRHKQLLSRVPQYDMGSSVNLNHSCRTFLMNWTSYFAKKLGLVLSSLKSKIHDVLTFDCLRKLVGKTLRSKKVYKDVACVQERRSDIYPDYVSFFKHMGTKDLAKNESSVINVLSRELPRCLKKRKGVGNYRVHHSRDHCYKTAIEQQPDYASMNESERRLQEALLCMNLHHHLIRKHPLSSSCPHKSPAAKIHYGVKGMGKPCELHFKKEDYLTTSSDESSSCSSSDHEREGEGEEGKHFVVLSNSADSSSSSRILKKKKKKKHHHHRSHRRKYSSCSRSRSSSCSSSSSDSDIGRDRKLYSYSHVGDELECDSSSSSSSSVRENAKQEETAVDSVECNMQNCCEFDSDKKEEEESIGFIPSRLKKAFVKSGLSPRLKELMVKAGLTPIPSAFRNRNDIVGLILSNEWASKLVIKQTEKLMKYKLFDLLLHYDARFDLLKGAGFNPGQPINIFSGSMFLPIPKTIEEEKTNSSNFEKLKGFLEKLEKDNEYIISIPNDDILDKIFKKPAAVKIAVARTIVQFKTLTPFERTVSLSNGNFVLMNPKFEEEGDFKKIFRYLVETPRPTTDVMNKAIDKILTTTGSSSSASSSLIGDEEAEEVDHDCCGTGSGEEEEEEEPQESIEFKPSELIPAFKDPSLLKLLNRKDLQRMVKLLGWAKELVKKKTTHYKLLALLHDFDVQKYVLDEKNPTAKFELKVFSFNSTFPKADDTKTENDNLRTLRNSKFDLGKLDNNDFVLSIPKVSTINKMFNAPELLKMEALTMIVKLKPKTLETKSEYNGRFILGILKRDGESESVQQEYFMKTDFASPLLERKLNKLLSLPKEFRNRKDILDMVKENDWASNLIDENPINYKLLDLLIRYNAINFLNISPNTSTKQLMILSSEQILPRKLSKQLDVSQGLNFIDLKIKLEKFKEEAEIEITIPSDKTLNKLFQSSDIIKDFAAAEMVKISFGIRKGKTNYNGKFKFGIDRGGVRGLETIIVPYFVRTKLAGVNFENQLNNILIGKISSAIYSEGNGLHRSLVADEFECDAGCYGADSEKEHQEEQEEQEQKSDENIGFKPGKTDKKLALRFTDPVTLKLVNRLDIKKMISANPWVAKLVKGTPLNYKLLDLLILYDIRFNLEEKPKAAIPAPVKAGVPTPVKAAIPAPVRAGIDPKKAVNIFSGGMLIPSPAGDTALAGDNLLKFKWIRSGLQELPAGYEYQIKIPDDENLTEIFKKSLKFKLDLLIHIVNYVKSPVRTTTSADKGTFKLTIQKLHGVEIYDHSYFVNVEPANKDHNITIRGLLIGGISSEIKSNSNSNSNS